jgi:hypothetical protein
MAPMLPLPSETSARLTGSFVKNLHRLPVFLEEGLTKWLLVAREDEIGAAPTAVRQLIE